MVEGLRRVLGFAAASGIKAFQDFKEKADEDLLGIMKRICSYLQDVLKEEGDWKIYPFAVHNLVAKGRVLVEDRTVYLDGNKLPEYGYRLDEHSH